KEKAAADLDLQAQIIQSLAEGLLKRPVDGPVNRRDHAAPLLGWAEEVASRLLASDDGRRIPWTAVPIDGLPPSENPWVIAPRPPRNATAGQFTWNLSKHAGKQGFIELVDGDTGNAYAWLAVGRFSLAALNPSDAAKKQQLAAEIVGKLKLQSLQPQLVSLAL